MPVGRDLIDRLHGFLVSDLCGSRLVGVGDLRERIGRALRLVGAVWIRLQQGEAAYRAQLLLVGRPHTLFNSFWCVARSPTAAM